MPDTNLDKLKNLLAELFMLDQADLDFGIYRVMNAKRAEVTRFLDNDLLPQVRTELATIQTGDRAALESDIAKAIAAGHAAGFTAEQANQSPKVKELRTQLAATVDVSALENEVLSDLANFFRRYYQEGDFLALRRYKAGVYAIPYEGEEVKLHWANADQYYIKTTEFLRDYTFKLGDDKRVHFKLVEADTEADNKKAANGQERRFILCATDPLLESNGELIIRFEYRPDAEKRKQSELNKLAVETILNVAGFTTWKASIARPAPTEKNPGRTLLEKHLGDYTARNTFDYFIHKDIGGFLRRELDFFIKNEIMHLDDIESEDAPHVEQYLAKIKAIRAIARKIITFLEQLENFQKKLWLKKKFVVETNYCVTLDRVPESLYPEIAAKEAQWQEWEKLFAISEIAPDLFNQKNQCRDVKFLKANPFLVLDTKFFPAEFKEKLLADNRVLGGAATLDEATDGLLIQGGNFHALRLLLSKYRQRVKCVYADPPYNTTTTDFAYKNEYQHGSWLSMMQQALAYMKKCLADDGVSLIAIDDAELTNLQSLCREIFGHDNMLGTLIVEIKPSGRTNDNYLSTSHEYYLCAAANNEDTQINFFPLTEEQIAAFAQTDSVSAYKYRDFLRTGGYSTPEERPNSYYPIYHDAAGKISLERFEGAIETFPIDSTGKKRVWRKTPPSFLEHLAAGDFQIKKSGEQWKIYIKDRIKVGIRPKSVWVASKYDAASHGTKLLANMFGGQPGFTFPKSLYAVADCVRMVADSSSIVLDPFAGSGTTGHAVISLNREDEDGGKRKYILVEMGDYFDTVLKPRIQKAIYSEDWKDGKPVSREGSSHLFKYIRLESYEDALNNLELKRAEAQDDLLRQHSQLREDYMLRYQLDVETRNSASLLNVAQFTDPFAYQLKIANGSVGESRAVNVDLVETFNYLLGLRVNHMDTIRGFKVITGLNPAGEKVLVIWRRVAEKSNTDLDAFFQKQGYNTKDMEFAVIYVNGDNNLENLKRADETWKVRRTEDEFKRLMFDVEDV